ncbi:MAG TPA: endolytic transglycosylase MltG [Actinomycetota bacterium]|nr:endolytic transglycosylase MltG [Actinomycetota bacterium]
MLAPRHAPPRRAARSLLILLLAFAILGGGAAGMYVYAIGASGPRQPVTVEVPEGATASEVGTLLAEAGVIRSALAFRVAAGVNGLGPSLQAGTYRMTTNMPLSEVLAVLEDGPPPPKTVSVTFPEGLEVAEVAEVAAAELGLGRKAFEQIATSGRFAAPPYLPEGTETVEGFLFPKTYEFPPRVDEAHVIARLIEQFEGEVEGLPWGRARRLGLSPYEVVIVASLIEREARVPQDRAKISAVIYNRLREGMPLQIDATVQYALPEDNRLLTVEDYEYPSPYNTYLHPGLPPTPIASPGLASLEAALRPADADYLYFVVIDDSGRHAFAETYDEFLRLKEQAGLS